MSEKINFHIDGKLMVANKGETIWQVAKKNGTTLPHLCYADKPRSRADGGGRGNIVVF